MPSEPLHERLPLSVSLPPSLSLFSLIRKPCPCPILILKQKSAQVGFKKALNHLTNNTERERESETYIYIYIYTCQFTVEGTWNWPELVEPC